MRFIKKHHVLLFFITWFLINILQASQTELINDEAYYWIYSKFPDWGYFDHPPMIAVLIRAGYRLFHNELGVRLLMVTLSTLTLVITYLMLPRRHEGLFYAISCSFAALQIGGILAVPDIPLAFFVALFFLAYRNFIRNMSWAHTFLLGIVMALMLYSKYHGILVILCTLISYPALATKGRAYMAVLTGILLFTPHLYWQYTHGFPSVQYHLFERNAPDYRVVFTTEYILGQLLLTGPLVGWLLIWAAFRYRPADALERALKFSMAGFYLFFLISTFKGRVEPNWTVPVFIPLIILSHQYLLDQPRLRRILVLSVPLTLLLVIAVRTYMMMDISPIRYFPKDEFHNNKLWAQRIYRQSGGLPVVFVDSYQKAAKYYFYSGIPAFSLNTPRYRRNNFNFWPIEDSLYNRKVAIIDYSCLADSIRRPCIPNSILAANGYFSFSKVQITAAKKLEVRGGLVRRCRLAFSSQASHLAAFQLGWRRNQAVQLWVMQHDKIVGRFSTNIRLSAITHQQQVIITGFRVNLPKGTYLAKYALPSYLAYDPSLNSTTIQLDVQ